MQAQSVLQETAEIASSGEWVELTQREASGWNDRLLMAKAPLLQFPFWNEPYRKLGLQPRYLRWADGEGNAAYVCVLSVSVLMLRSGIIKRGPVSLSPGRKVPLSALKDLCRWAREQGYACLRFTHSDDAILEETASLAGAVRLDPAPFYRDSDLELIVDQLPDEGKMLAGFDREARRKIRRAQEVGYELRSGDTVGDLKAVWHVLVQCSERKGFRLPMRWEACRDLVTLARQYDCVRIYSAWYKGAPVQAILVVRDSHEALAYLAGLDFDSLPPKSCSPSVLLHWHAMRDLYRQGIRHYNFGGAPSTVKQFKDQFSPRVHDFPEPVTIPTRNQLFKMWMAALPVVNRYGMKLRFLAATLSGEREIESDAA